MGDFLVLFAPVLRQIARYLPHHRSENASKTHPKSSHDKFKTASNYHEDGDGGVKWRVPNLNELVMMRRALTVGNLNSLCCTQFSNSNVRLGFVATSNVNCEVGGYNNGGYWDWLEPHGVRCVRDVPDGYAFPKN
ncbi:hypothetical protein H6A30_13635 [Bacteroides caecigallinarum]|uniref:hypothetical protein n=1 Tax=Bacteroides caecigallinarum TaxID=1411144 RepID=UPI00195B156F|nr:hypothetical protein [Bacteroides caecigallinarum]MBM6891271.1 hypothetical protein [Bacteroides caecigallinarum]